MEKTKINKKEAEIGPFKTQFVNINFLFNLASLSDYRNKLFRGRRIKWKKVLNQYLPFTDWLFNYNIKNDLVADIVAGITIAIMNIPQGKVVSDFILYNVSDKTQLWPILKQFTLVIYDSRVVPDLKMPHITTLDS